MQPGRYVENIDFSGKNILLLGDPENPQDVIINGNEQGRVVTINNGENEAALCGFTIIGGLTVRIGGAGIYVEESSVVISNCRIVENRTRTWPDLNGNMWWGRGAGIECNASELTLIDCLFLDNRSGRYGGAIHCLLESVVNISNCVFNHNGGSEGAHIGCWESELNISDCEFTDAGAGDDGNIRYGIFLSDAVASIENCSIHDDFSSIVALNSDATINGCNFDRNHATSGYGGAIWGLGESRIIVTRSVFSHNRAFNGGHAVYGTEESEVLLVNCTITQHEDVSGSILGGVDVLNSIIWGNASDWYQNSTFTFCNVQTGADGEGNIDENPLFVDPDEGDYNLTADSPCIDVGNPEADLDPDGTRADMGAYYYHQGPGIVVSADSLHFGVVLIDSTLELALTITNEAMSGLRLTQSKQTMRLSLTVSMQVPSSSRKGSMS